MRYPRFALFVLLALGQLVPALALAQTPTAGTPAAGAASCAGPARSPAELLELWFAPDGTPTSAPRGFAQLPDATSLPTGTSVDAATLEKIDEVVAGWVTCTNAGDALRAAALLTDAYAQRQRIPVATQQQAEARLGEPPVAVAPAEQWSVGAVQRALVMPDGRVGALYPAVGMRAPGIASTVYIVLAQDGDAWRIDDALFIAAADPTAPVAGFEVVAQYPHDRAAYTQGLVYNPDGTFYEGTGLYGESTLRLVEAETGEVLRSVPLDDDQFGEGVAVIRDRIYQLTWQTGTAFVYDRETFDPLGTFTYDTEGWGLTTDGERLIMSDGSSRIVFRDPETFAATGAIDVRDGKLPVSNLNELELIDGEIWANVYQTNRIARIDPASGDVIGWIDLTGLLDRNDPANEGAEVLNGIAWDQETGRIFVTGKLWPSLFEIRLVPPQ